MAPTTTLRLEYSAFFSSGLLAQRTPQKKVNSSSLSWDDSADNAIFDRSPSRPSSPIPVPDDSLMDIDMASCGLGADDGRRSTTPTPETITPMQSPQPIKIQPMPHTQQSTQPTLRKRRSSLTLATSPMNAIRSPTRTASNAIHLQRQLSNAVSPRSRSGSVSGEDATAPRYSNTGVASSETSLEGRMRSGSLGSAPAAPVALRRRPIRRLHLSALQAPLTPPPTAPLPDLPSSTHSDQQQFRPKNLNSPTYPPSTRTAHTKVPSSFSTSSASTTSARARGLSVSSSALDGAENRIDEDMKEN